MKKIVLISALFALAGCETTGQTVTCANAAKVRAAAVNAIKVIDQLCPLDVPVEAPVDAEPAQD
jgi:uncharacterized lipoprotein YajG